MVFISCCGEGFIFYVNRVVAHRVYSTRCEQDAGRTHMLLRIFLRYIAVISFKCFIEVTAIAVAQHRSDFFQIGNSAFRGCSSLEEIIISSGVKYIGDYAFEGCSSLENVIMWRRSTKIEKDAFATA